MTSEYGNKQLAGINFPALISPSHCESEFYSQIHWVAEAFVAQSLQELLGSRTVSTGLTL